jgi:hypothetical protein
MKADDYRMMPPLPDLTRLSDGTRGLRSGGFGYRLEYEYTPAVRPMEASPVGQHFIARVERDVAPIADFFDEMIRLKDNFAAITTSQVNDSDPHWDNIWLPAMDGMSIYALIAARKPKVYLEVGSGNSTKFARRAVRDHNTGTRIVSVDPQPRAEIDALCDDVLRLPVEHVDVQKLAALLSPGDVVFVDNSHRSFQNSDVTVCCLDLLTAIPPGCYFGVHDIFLPYDYPEFFLERFYNEQYLLQMYFLGGAREDTIICPSYMAHKGHILPEKYAAMHDVPSIPISAWGGGSLWWRKGDWTVRTRA